MKITAAIDGSDHSTRALEFAAKLAAASHAELIILTVCQRIIDEEMRRFGRIENAAIGEIIEQEANGMLGEAKARAEAFGANHILTVMAEGDPAEVLLDHAHTTNVVVIGKRGQGRLVGLLLGSVSQKLVALSPVPVVIVP